MDELLGKKTKQIAILAFGVIAAGLLLYFLLFRYDVVSAGVSTFFSVLSPIIYGFVIAYILNPVMCFIENTSLRIWSKCKKKPGVRALSAVRLFSIFTTIIFVSVLCYTMIALLLPELVNSVQNILTNVPTYSDNIQKWYSGLVDKYVTNESSKETVTNILKSSQTWIIEQFSPQLNGFLSTVTSGLIDGLILFKNIILGLFISIYILLSKDSILARFRRGLYAFFNVATVNRILKNLQFVDEKFGGFLVGKILDSLIIGVICYIVLACMGMPYTLLVAVVVGVTNIIPFFGPFLGAIPSAILIGCISPVQALYFIIVILVLSQIDANIIGPKILGNSVGVSSLMVLVAIFIGGGLFGFVGMIIGVPVCAILTAFIQSVILRRIASKNLPGDISAYHNMDCIDPANRRVIPIPDDKKSLSFYKRIQHKDEAIRAFEIPIENNPWDRTLEEVESQRRKYVKDWQTDRAYCRKRKKANNAAFIEESNTPRDNAPETVSDKEKTQNEEHPITTETDPKTGR